MVEWAHVQLRALRRLDVRSEYARGLVDGNFHAANHEHRGVDGRVGCIAQRLERAPLRVVAFAPAACCRAPVGFDEP